MQQMNESYQNTLDYFEEILLLQLEYNMDNGVGVYETVSSEV